MRGLLKQLAWKVTPFVEESIERLAPITSKRLALVDTDLKLNQLLLASRYSDVAAGRRAPMCLRDTEFRAFSQNGEDGILLYLFSLIDMTNRTSVEVCAADGIECNTANLIINHGWRGLLIDGSKANVARGRAFYRRYKGKVSFQPNFVNAWVTRESINGIIRQAGFGGEIDLLSLDLDGVDYWIRQALDVVQPRVVVLEYNASLGPNAPSRSRINPTSPSTLERVDHWGASLPAFVKLGRKKGYRLVGVESMCRNAFFVRDGVGRSSCRRSPRPLASVTPDSPSYPLSQPTVGRGWTSSTLVTIGFSHEALVGVKCGWKHGWSSSQAFTLGCLCVP